jgi:hypothetical protein
VGVAEIQEAVTNELKKARKRKIFDSFSEIVQSHKACIYANGAYLEIKKRNMSSTCVLDLKKISAETFGPHCVLENSQQY